MTAHSAASLENAALTDDAFLGGELQILQPESGYRAGLDAVMLAAAVAGQPAPQGLVFQPISSGACPLKRNDRERAVRFPRFGVLLG